MDELELKVRQLIDDKMGVEPVYGAFTLENGTVCPAARWKWLGPVDDPWIIVFRASDGTIKTTRRGQDRFTAAPLGVDHE
jgi:hypothetical protein